MVRLNMVIYFFLIHKLIRLYVTLLQIPTSLAILEYKILRRKIS